MVYSSSYLKLIKDWYSSKTEYKQNIDKTIDKKRKIQNGLNWAQHFKYQLRKAYISDIEIIIIKYNKENNEIDQLFRWATHPMSPAAFAVFVPRLS